MAHEGDYYTVVLKEAHLNWGEHRHTGTREIVEGEGYVPIPLCLLYTSDAADE